METNSEDGGTLADVEAAGAAGRRAALPWWLLALEVLFVAGVWSMVYGGPQTWRNILLAFAVFAVPVMVLVVIAKRRGRVGAFAPGSRASVVSWVGFFGAMFAGMISAKYLEAGRPLTYVAVFAVVVVIYGGCRVAAERLTVRQSA
ncbi:MULTISPECIES: hypothetical protein [Tsukamurella]|uniref:Uncharacterized protein n=2 Tax=Tsukamurella TaxID=2060 RepID=A0A5C5S3L9_9ACTN|nr:MULTISPECIES: hypothetical protein [Tsukamurella]NMD56450.1 hypothetical protein [Tsukamurella columbiensis]TWS29203.1 hypothetical protein FK530_10390 [Tsukamurella conjunctivitidis]